MDRLSTASSFATIVGLLAGFASHRSQRSSDDYAQFLEWLSENRHHEVLELLKANVKTSTGIKAILNEDRRELIRRLDQLDAMLAKLASRFEGFEALAEGMRPGVSLSPQAFRILNEFERSNASNALEVDFDSKRVLIFFGNVREQHQIELEEPRFADDDIQTLVDLRFLQVDSWNSSGKPIYSITRPAVEYVRQVRAGAPT